MLRPGNWHREKAIPRMVLPLSKIPYRKQALESHSTFWDSPSFSNEAKKVA